ncbi:hypothetical protein RS030_2204 [Cryptosporidium xiaoi]|uniref:3-oxo-5-alpha-steroid 4-dehydrogenase C-terminal domain-containing protein n=1 Tax=Cryptosporidium xiaoi TaxID=659607 RepID=A0AAV9XW97_9CRYT
MEFFRSVGCGITELLACYFLLSALMVIFSCIFRRVGSLTVHGKLNFRASGLGNGEKTVVYVLLKKISKISVSKSLFSHFYLVGIFTTLCFIYIKPTSYRTILFLVHVLRRYLEEKIICIHNTEYSEMNVFVYLYGLSYYIAMPTMIYSIPELSRKTAIYQFSLFVLFSVLQIESHIALSDIRRNKGLKYGIPYGMLFKYVSSPHYLCEICIYTSLFFDVFIDFKYVHVMAALVYIVLCMSINAIRTHNWYLEHFKNSYVILRRKVIVPFLF